MKSLLLFLLIFTTLAGSALAQDKPKAFINGNRVYTTMCKYDVRDKSDASELMFAHNMWASGYVVGAADALILANREEKNEQLKFCLPSEITIKRITDQVCHYMSSNKDALNESAPSLIHVALMDKWSCVKY